MSALHTVSRAEHARRNFGALQLASSGEPRELVHVIEQQSALLVGDGQLPAKLGVLTREYNHALRELLQHTQPGRVDVGRRGDGSHRRVRGLLPQIGCQRSENSDRRRLSRGSNNSGNSRWVWSILTLVARAAGSALLRGKLGEECEGMRAKSHQSHHHMRHAQRSHTDAGVERGALRRLRDCLVAPWTPLAPLRLPRPRTDACAR